MILFLLAASNDWNALDDRIREALGGSEELPVILRAETDVTYGYVVAALDAIREAGAPVRFASVPEAQIPSPGDQPPAAPILPLSSTGEVAASDPNQVVLDILADGHWAMEGQGIDEGRFQRVVRNRRDGQQYLAPDGRTVNYPLIVRADVGAPWGTVARALMVAAVHGGITDIRLAAVDGEGREVQIRFPLPADLGMAACSGVQVEAPEVRVSMAGGEASWEIGSRTVCGACGVEHIDMEPSIDPDR